MKNLVRSTRNRICFYDENANEKHENASLLLDIFDSEPGYYHQIIRPLLTSNDEELFAWLKTTGLIKSEQVCKERTGNVVCNKPMSCVKVKGQDLFRWECKTCSTMKSIRYDSVFSDLCCSYKDAIRIILAWCKGHHVDYVRNMLGVKNLTIQKLYTRASNVAEKYMRSNIGDWQLGGPGVVVVVDTYPEGCANISRAKTTRPILCISEIKSIPQKYWLEPLDRFSLNNTICVNALKRRISHVVQTMVRPGSILVTPATSLLCSYDDFQHLRALYPTIVNVRDLARHNNDHQNIFSNMETIWRCVLDICEEAQFYCRSYIDLFVVSQMWRAVYGTESFERLLYQISLTQ